MGDVDEIAELSKVITEATVDLYNDVVANFLPSRSDNARARTRTLRELRPSSMNGTSASGGSGSERQDCSSRETRLRIAMLPSCANDDSVFATVTVDVERADVAASSNAR